MIGDRRGNETWALDEACYLVPYSFQINGTSNPTVVQGDIIRGRAVTRVSAGKFTFQVTDGCTQVVGGTAPSVSGGDAEDIYAQADYASATSNGGTVTIRTKTGATNTDPANGEWITGAIIMKANDRRAIT